MSLKVVNFTDFRNNLKNNLDAVSDNNDTLIVSRAKKSAVILSLDEYNSLMETLHLLSSDANVLHLQKSLAEAKSGKTKEINLKNLQSKISKKSK